MSFDLSAITSEAITRAPRILLLGTPKIGKTTFASQFPGAVILPIKGEEGADDFAIPKTPTCHSYQDVMQWLYSMFTQKHEYKAVVIDTVSALEPLLHEETVKRYNNTRGPKSPEARGIEDIYGGYSKGYSEALTEWRELTTALDVLRAEQNMGSILIGHVIIRRQDDPIHGSYDTWDFAIHHKAAALLYQWADCILFCNTRMDIKTEDAGFGKEKKRGIDYTGGQRFLYTQARPGHPGGGRGVYGNLPYELPLNYDAFCDAVHNTLGGEKTNE